MSRTIHRVILALALAGMAAAGVAQSDSPPPGAGDQHDWHGGGRGDGADEDEWRGHGDWDHGGHRHHHHHHGRGHWGHHGRWREGRWEHHGGGGGGPGKLMMSFRMLDLTPAQRDQMHTILMSAMKARHEQQDQGVKGAQSSKNGPDRMALANPGDPNYAAAVQAAKKRAVERIQEASDLQMKLYNVLTPAQKADLTKRIAERNAKMAQWRSAPH